MKTDILNIWISRVGLAAIAFVSLGYVIFGPSFAQLRLQFSFLDFPVFIGEILLAFCLLLFAIKSVRQKQPLGPWGWMVGGYLFFVLLKAFFGYFAWGPLAFRDAALFYYPLFILMGYSFWSDDFDRDSLRRLCIALILGIFIVHQFIRFWPCSLMIMGGILALRAKSFQERALLVAVILLFAPYDILFDVFFRAAFLSSLITAVFISITLFLLFCKDRRVRMMGAVLGCLVLGMILFKVEQTGILKTCFINDVKPLALEPSQETPSRAKYLFHPVGSLIEKPDTLKEFSQRINMGKIFMKKENATENATENTTENTTGREIATGKEIAADKESAPEKEPIIPYNVSLWIKMKDTVFRYYIWRDMVVEYLRYKPLFGFDFGRPLRSPTIEKYLQKVSSQYTDGWIGAHNSYLDTVYRAGIVGLIMILFLLFVWFALVRDFYILKDWTGVVLCAVLLNWMILANLFLIFELPYTAVPVWTILGITLKHRMLIKKHGQ